MNKSQMGRARVQLTFSIVALLISSCACVSTPTSSKPDPAAYAKEIEQYRAERLANLKSESGWLTLIGLFWLKEGENKFGSDPKLDIVLPSGKVRRLAGSFWLKDGAVRLDARPDSGITVDGQPASSLELKSDADDKVTVLHLGSLTIQIIKRNDKLGVRVKDKDNPNRIGFRGIETYPTDLTWRVEAWLEPYNPPKAMPIMNVLGMESDEPSPGAVVFQVDGQTYQLDAITEPDEPRLFMIFADKTSGKETYGAGRYLYIDPADSSGHIVIDFNKAYSPPCAFTNYATCPLPPKQNILSLAIEAGEKYKEHPKRPH